VLGRYDYDHAGNRIRKRHGDRGDIDTYHDDGAVLEEYDAGDGSLLAYYEYADRLVALVQPQQPQQTQYYHHDALGSTIGLTDQYGNDAKSYHLDPWGRIRWQTGTSPNRHIFTGKQHDPNTGLVYFGARYYDPTTARFITQDSYLGEPDQPPSLHRYLYAYSIPTVYVDLEGYAASWADMVQGAEALGHTLLEGQRLMSDADQAVKDFVADTMEASEARSRALAKMWADEIAAGRSYAGFAHLAGTAAVLGTSEPYEEAKKEVKEKIFRDVQKAKAVWKGLPGEEAVTTMMDYGGAAATAVVEASMPEGPVSAAAMVAGPVLGKSGGLVGKGKTALTKADDAGAATAKLAGSSSGGGGASVASQARRIAEDVRSQFLRLARSERGSIPIGRGKPLKKYSRPAIAEVPAARGAGRAIGFADDAVGSAYQGMRSGGGHAMRHLMDEGLIPNAGSIASRARQFEDLTSPILRNPTKSFDWRIGNTAARAFAGEAGGSRVVVFVAKEGPYQGRVLSAVVPDATQIAQWGL
jgi:RHS repeat-associated protein